MPRDRAKERRMRKDLDRMFDFCATTEMKLDRLRLKSAMKSVYMRSIEVKMLRESLELASKRKVRDYVS
jgi:hypothetical protein